VIPRIADNRANGIIGLDEGQAGALINMYEQQDFAQFVPVPQILLKYLNETQTGGARDSRVKNADAYASRHNETDKRILKLIARKETEDGNTAGLTDIDLRLGDKLQAEFRERFNGPEVKHYKLLS